tara:strand:+ start:3321 stop:4805 length:1485 start_codon:yes stop_codon:yes gene_type:complete
MSFELPKDCEGLKVPELPDFQKSIVDAVMNGNAFQNPFGDALGGVGDMLSGAGGIGESISSLLAFPDGLDSGVVSMLEGLQESLGFNSGFGGASGILGTLSEFRGHMDKLSGVGDLSEFSERLGIGTALEGAKQELGLGAGGFGDMFSSFENGGVLLDGIQGQLGNLKNMLTEAVSVGDAFDFDVTALSAIGAGVLTFGDDIMGQINLDNNEFSKAKETLQKIGIAKMVTTDTNCYVNKLLTDMIGKPDVVSALPNALAEKSGPILTETEKLAVEQSKKSKIEEIKAQGIKSTKIAELVGESQTDKPEEIEKVKSRPVYEPPKEDLVQTIRDGVIDFSKQFNGEPVWDDKSRISENGRWIQWYQEYKYYPDGFGRGPTVTGQDVTDEILASSPYSIQDRIFEWNDTFKKWQHGKIDSQTPVVSTVNKFAQEDESRLLDWRKYAQQLKVPVEKIVAIGYFGGEKYGKLYDVETKDTILDKSRMDPWHGLIDAKPI